MVSLFSYDANRGNVAVIVWNTIVAPYVWDVTGTEFTDSSINLSNSERSLLSIYFRDYADKNGELKEIKEVEITEAKIDDRQLKLSLTSAEVTNFGFESEPRKNKDEKSYKTSTTNVVIYVPEEVVADLDELEDKYVTIILGEDNIAVAVIVEEEATEKDFLTSYDAVKERITVGATKYDLAMENTTVKYSVELNGSNKANIAEALEAILGEDADLEKIEKKIQAEITLNEDDEVEAIELFVSTSVLDNTTEVVVTDINETSKKYEIETTAGDIKWELEDEEDLDFPKVYTNGTRSDIKDIEAGNVLTIITGAANASDIKFGGNAIAKIYVGTETVTGEATRVKKANNAITVDGTVYPATTIVAEDLLMTTEDLEDNDFTAFNSTTVLDNEEVTLYLNVMGEYVAVSVAEDASNYQFGIVTDVIKGTDWEVINDEEYAIRTIRVLLDNGNVTRFKVRTNVDDTDTPNADKLDDIVEALENEFVMFEANSDKVITLSEDENEIISATTTDDYVVVTGAQAATIAGKRITVGPETYTYTDSTVVFNNHAEVTSDDTDKVKQEVVSNWNSILTTAKTGFEMAANEDSEGDELIRTALIVTKKNSTKALYIVVDSTYSSSDYELAVVTRKLDEVKDDKYEVDFDVASDLEVTGDAIEALTDVIDWLVAYTTKNGKVNTAAPIIDMDALTDFDADDVIEGIFASTEDDTLVLDDAFTADVNFAQLEVSEIYIDGDDYADIVFSAGENKKVSNAAYMFENSEETYYTLEGEYEYNAAVEDEFDPEATTYYIEDPDNAGEYILPDEQPEADEWVDATFFTKDWVEDYVEATTYNEAKTYYVEDDGDYVEVDLKDLDAQLGTIELDAEELKVYDLRDGKAEEITLTTTENPGFSAVVYKEAGATKANVIFIID